MGQFCDSTQLESDIILIFIAQNVVHRVEALPPPRSLLEMPWASQDLLSRVSPLRSLDDSYVYLSLKTTYLNDSKYTCCIS